LLRCSFIFNRINNNIDLKELVESTYEYKENKKKLFIKILLQIINEEKNILEDHCEHCGQDRSSESDHILINRLESMVRQIKENTYSDNLFRYKNKNKVEIV
jgi:hypothetical protein